MVLLDELLYVWPYAHFIFLSLTHPTHTINTEHSMEFQDLPLGAAFKDFF